jgi:hypothetical protein
MFIDGISFLISVAEGLGLVMVNHIANRKTEVIRTALHSMINKYRSRDFQIKKVIKSDGEGAFNNSIITESLNVSK